MYSMSIYTGVAASQVLQFYKKRCRHILLGPSFESEENDNCFLNILLTLIAESILSYLNAQQTTEETFIIDLSKMKSFAGYISLAVLSLQLVYAADIEYAVVAFPQAQQSVSVIVGGQSYPLAQSPEFPNIYKGVAPSADQYQYAVGDVPETVPRKQQAGITTTGNEFFNRTQTIFNVPALPQAYNPVYHRKSIDFK
jgi:hypothetical protein